MNDLYSNYIHDSSYDVAHYGVMGMHWGHRKADAYDNIYYRSKYNKKKNRLKNELKSGKINKSKYAMTRTGDVLNRYLLDPQRQGWRSVGRSLRGVGRLVSGKTIDRHNDREYTQARDRAKEMVGDADLMKKLDKLAQLEVNTTSAGAGYSGYYDAINDILDREQLKYRRK